MSLDFNSTKVQFGAPTVYDIERKLNHFNSTKVQFGVSLSKPPIFPLNYFNSTKVQFGDRQIETADLNNLISIPLRYNLERLQIYKEKLLLQFQFH